jgi:hypothetical protein
MACYRCGRVYIDGKSMQHCDRTSDLIVINFIRSSWYVSSDMYSFVDHSSIRIS